MLYLLITLKEFAGRLLRFAAAGRRFIDILDSGKVENYDNRKECMTLSSGSASCNTAMLAFVQPLGGVSCE